MKYTNYIDLHMHSTNSDDGSYTPTQLVDMCHKAGIKIMALSDHNSVDGVIEAVSRAKELDITCIPAIELDCTYQHLDLHVLAYGINPEDPVFVKLQNSVRTQDQNGTLEKIEKTRALGFDVKFEDFTDIMWNGIITGEMFAEVLLDDPRYEDNELLKPYRANEPKGDNPYVNFYWDYYAKGKPCYVPMVYPEAKYIIGLIKSTGAVPVLAHPGNNLKADYSVVEDLIRLGIEGIEVFSNYHDEKTNHYFYEVCKKHNLLISCGSDFHGKTKPAIHLGQCGVDIDPMIIENMLKEKNLLP